MKGKATKRCINGIDDRDDYIEPGVCSATRGNSSSFRRGASIHFGTSVMSVFNLVRGPSASGHKTQTQVAMQLIPKQEVRRGAGAISSSERCHRHVRDGIRQAVLGPEEIDCAGLFKILREDRYLGPHIRRQTVVHLSNCCQHTCGPRLPSSWPVEACSGSRGLTVRDSAGPSLLSLVAAAQSTNSPAANNHGLHTEFAARREAAEALV